MKKLQTTGYRVVFHSIKGATQKEIQLFHRAAIHLENVVASSQFKEIIFKSTFSNAKGMTNRGIYDLILSGRDNFGKADGDLDVEVTIYTSRWSKVIGYTYPNTMRSWINRKFLGREWTIAGNLMHEGMHNAGFSDGPSGKDRNSVPYITGAAVTYLVKKVLNDGLILTPAKNK